MVSAALTNFETFVNNLSIPQARKDALLVKGEQFYDLVYKEVTKHIRRHIVALIATNSGNAENIARLNFLKTMTDRIDSEDQNTVLGIIREFDF